MLLSMEDPVLPRSLMSSVDHTHRRQIHRTDTFMETESSSFSYEGVVGNE